MKGVDSRGVEVFVDKARPPKRKKRVDPLIALATDQELRGMVARFFISQGLPPARASRLIRRSKSQLYRDMKAGESLLDVGKNPIDQREETA